MCTTKSDFYSDAHELTKLPDYVDKEQALRNLVETWKQKAPAISDVLAGRDSFERIVEPLVKENLRIRFPYYFNGACCSEEYQREARDIQEQLKDVLPQEHWIIIERFQNRLRLAEPVKFPMLGICLGFLSPMLIAGIVASVMVSIVSAISYVIPEVGIDAKDGFCFIAFVGVLWGLIVFSQFMINEICCIVEQRDLARKVLLQAQFLDSILDAYNWDQ